MSGKKKAIKPAAGHNAIFDYTDLMGNMTECYSGESLEKANVQSRNKNSRNMGFPNRNQAGGIRGNDPQSNSHGRNNERAQPQIPKEEPPSDYEEETSPKHSQKDAANQHTVSNNYKNEKSHHSTSPTDSDISRSTSVGMEAELTGTPNSTDHTTIKKAENALIRHLETTVRPLPDDLWSQLAEASNANNSQTVKKAGVGSMESGLRLALGPTPSNLETQRKETNITVGKEKNSGKAEKSASTSKTIGSLLPEVKKDSPLGKGDKYNSTDAVRPLQPLVIANRNNSHEESAKIIASDDLSPRCANSTSLSPVDVDERNVEETFEKFEKTTHESHLVDDTKKNTKNQYKDVMKANDSTPIVCSEQLNTEETPTVLQNDLSQKKTSTKSKSTFSHSQFKVGSNEVSHKSEDVNSKKHEVLKSNTSKMEIGRSSEKSKFKENGGISSDNSKKFFPDKFIPFVKASLNNEKKSKLIEPQSEVSKEGRRRDKPTTSKDKRQLESNEKRSTLKEQFKTEDKRGSIMIPNDNHKLSTRERSAGHNSSKHPVNRPDGASNQNSKTLGGNHATSNAVETEQKTSSKESSLIPNVELKMSSRKSIDSVKTEKETTKKSNKEGVRQEQMVMSTKNGKAELEKRKEPDIFDSKSSEKKTGRKEIRLSLKEYYKREESKNKSIGRRTYSPEEKSDNKISVDNFENVSLIETGMDTETERKEKSAIHVQNEVVGNKGSKKRDKTKTTEQYGETTPGGLEELPKAEVKKQGEKQKSVVSNEVETSSQAKSTRSECSKSVANHSSPTYQKEMISKQSRLIETGKPSELEEATRVFNLPSSTPEVEYKEREEHAEKDKFEIAVILESESPTNTTPENEMSEDDNVKDLVGKVVEKQDENKEEVISNDDSYEMLNESAEDLDVETIDVGKILEKRKTPQLKEVDQLPKGKEDNAGDIINDIHEGVSLAQATEKSTTEQVFVQDEVLLLHHPLVEIHEIIETEVAVDVISETELVQATEESPAVQVSTQDEVIILSCSIAENHETREIASETGLLQAEENITDHESVDILPASVESAIIDKNQEENGQNDVSIAKPSASEYAELFENGVKDTSKRENVHETPVEQDEVIILSSPNAEHHETKETENIASETELAQEEENIINHGIEKILPVSLKSANINQEENEQDDVFIGKSSTSESAESLEDDAKEVPKHEDVHETPIETELVVLTTELEHNQKETSTSEEVPMIGNGEASSASTQRFYLTPDLSPNGHSSLFSQRSVVSDGQQERLGDSVPSSSTISLKRPSQYEETYHDAKSARISLEQSSAIALESLAQATQNITVANPFINPSGFIQSMLTSGQTPVSTPAPALIVPALDPLKVVTKTECYIPALSLSTREQVEQPEHLHMNIPVSNINLSGWNQYDLDFYQTFRLYAPYTGLQSHPIFTTTLNTGNNPSARLFPPELLHSLRK